MSKRYDTKCCENDFLSFVQGQNFNIEHEYKYQGKIMFPQSTNYA